MLLSPVSCVALVWVIYCYLGNHPRTFWLKTATVLFARGSCTLAELSGQFPAGLAGSHLHSLIQLETEATLLHRGGLPFSTHLGVLTG